MCCKRQLSICLRKLISKINPVTKVKKTEWHTLDTEDLRFKYSQAEKGDLYKELTVGKEVYDVQAWLKSVG